MHMALSSLNTSKPCMRLFLAESQHPVLRGCSHCSFTQWPVADGVEFQVTVPQCLNEKKAAKHIARLCYVNLQNSTKEDTIQYWNDLRLGEHLCGCSQKPTAALFILLPPSYILSSHIRQGKRKTSLGKYFAGQILCHISEHISEL